MVRLLTLPFSGVHVCMVGFALACLTACQPAEPVPDPRSLLFDRDWTLVDGRAYVDNVDLDHHLAYAHFDATQSVSSTSLFDTSWVRMDHLERLVTTWRFEEQEFVLNGADRFFLSEFQNGWGQWVLSPNGLHGGTSRPMIVQGLDEHHLMVTVRESHNSDGVYNYHYVSELLFADGPGSPPFDTTLWEGYAFNGTWKHTLSGSPEGLNGTSWILTRYNNGLSGTVYPNDTLDFLSVNEYAVNGGIPQPYALNGLVGSPRLSLTLYGMTSLGGDVTGQLLPDFIEQGTIQNAEFSDLFEAANASTVWMDRIE